MWPGSGTCTPLICTVITINLGIASVLLSIDATLWQIASQLLGRPCADLRAVKPQLFETRQSNQWANVADLCTV